MPRTIHEAIADYRQAQEVWGLGVLHYRKLPATRATPGYKLASRVFFRADGIEPNCVYRVEMTVPMYGVREGLARRFYYVKEYATFDLIRYEPDDRVVLSDGGFATATVRRMLDRFCPLGVCLKQGWCYVGRHKLWHTPLTPNEWPVRSPKPRRFTLLPNVAEFDMPPLRTSAALALCKAMLGDDAWGGMPILADALEEAGCGDPDLLAACRACDTDNDLVRTLLEGVT